MVTAGAIITRTCGSCTILFLHSGGSGSRNGGGVYSTNLGVMGMAYMVGGPPTLAGILLILSGLQRIGLINRMHPGRRRASEAMTRHERVRAFSRNHSQLDKTLARRLYSLRLANRRI